MEITIWDEKMRLSSDQDEAFIQQVADYLNSKMKIVREGDATLITTKIAALRTAYLIAAEFLMMKNQNSDIDGIDIALDELEAKFESLGL